MGMDRPPIFTKEGVLIRTPGMINKEKENAAIEKAIREEKTPEEQQAAAEAVFVKRKQTTEKDATRVEELKKNLGKAFSKEGLLDRNFGK